MRQRSAVTRKRFETFVPEPSEEALRAEVHEWLVAGENATDPPVAYCYAAYLAQAHREAPNLGAPLVASPLRRAVPEPKSGWITEDPEFGPYARIGTIREIALAKEPDPWTFKRFAAQKTALKKAGINQPVDISLAWVPGLRKHLDIDTAEFRHLVDAADIVRMVKAEFDDPNSVVSHDLKDRWRSISNYLVDERNFGLTGLALTLVDDQESSKLAREIGETVLWRASDREAAALRVLLARLADSMEIMI